LGIPLFHTPPATHDMNTHHADCAWRPSSAPFMERKE
jgi:hypothetical protein